MMRSFEVSRGSGDFDKISIKTKNLDECPNLVTLIRKIFHNPMIVGATINYSNGTIVRVDLEQ